MAGKNTAVFGIYPSRLAAEEAVDHLRSHGFRSTDVSVLLPENSGTKDLAHEKVTKAPEGVSTGAVAGGLAGGVLGWLTSVGILAIPELGPFVAAGPIVGSLAGAGAVGAVGSIIGALAGWGVPEYEAVRYEGRIREGGVLLSVHCDNSDWVKRAKEALKHTGAQDISSAGESSADYGKSDKPLPRKTMPPTVETERGIHANPVVSPTPAAVQDYDYDEDFRRDFQEHYYRPGVVY